MVLRSLATGLGMLCIHTALAAEFQLTSPVLKDGGVMPLDNVATECGGKNISPPLQWKNVPSGTKSFAVTAQDLDAPVKSRWLLWWVFNVPASVTGFPVNAGNPAAGLLPADVQQVAPDRAAPKPGYLGACPPKGDKPHRYAFTVTALGVDKINLISSDVLASSAYHVNKNALARATLTVTFGH